MREGQQVERRDADHRHPQRLGQRLAGGQPDAHAGEQARTDVDGDEADLVEPDVGLGADELDGRREDLGVAPAAGHLEQGDHALVPAERHADLLGRRLDAEDQHGGRSRRRAARPWPGRSAAHRWAHVAADGGDRDRAGVERRRRRASRRTTRWSPNVDSTTSPHSTSTMPWYSASSPSARSATSASWSRRYRSAWCSVDVAGVVAVHERERRRRDRLGHPERPAEALGERRLAGAHLAGQQDDVARPASRGQRRRPRRGCRRARHAQREARGRRHDPSMLRAPGTARPADGARGPRCRT